MHFVLVYRWYNNRTVCYNLTFCTKKISNDRFGLKRSSSYSELQKPHAYPIEFLVTRTLIWYFCAVHDKVTANRLLCQLTSMMHKNCTPYHNALASALPRICYSHSDRLPLRQLPGQATATRGSALQMPPQ